jgi:hypothetical protein
MKALTLYQPWASAIAAGIKRIETRAWASERLYGRPLAIHAGSRRVRPDELEEECLADLERAGLDPLDLPYGAVVCVVRVRVILATEYIVEDPDRWALTSQEKRWGDYSPGRWAWLLEPMRRVEPPPSVAGARGLWEWVPKGGSRG